MCIGQCLPSSPFAGNHNDCQSCTLPIFIQEAFCAEPPLRSLHQIQSDHEKINQGLKVSLYVQIFCLAFYNVVAQGKTRRLFGRRVNQLSLTREDSNGNHINRCSARNFVRWRGLGIFALAQELAPSKCHGEHFCIVTQSAVISERRAIHGNSNS